MNEAAENGSSLWPMITFGIYWAYLIATYEQRRRNGMKTFFDLLLSPHETRAAREPNSHWFAALANRQADFDEDSFLADAVKTYEFILTNYAAGNTEELVGLLSPDVFEVFSNHIEDRANRGEKLSINVVTFSDARIVAKNISTALSEVTVRFEADISVSNQDMDSDHPQKDSSELLNTIDIWTFQKRTNALTKTWVLVATETD